MKFGILGAGNIASTMARTITQMEGIEAYAVASRNLEKASAFAQEFGFLKSYGSYEELVLDPEVDIIYIATPHSFHAEHAKLCINHGKNVLCEKAFTQNAAQAKEVLALAEEKGVFITEAIWTRYMPSRRLINEILESGIVGKPQSLYADLSYPIMHKSRITEPSLAGGALLDIGVYGLNFASMAFGDDIKDVQTTSILSDKGVDMVLNTTIIYNDNKMAIIHSDARAASNREGAIYCENGYVVVENINNPEAILVYDKMHQLIKRVEVPEQITGYEYEVRACEKALKEGKKECAEMPHTQTIFMMELMDQIRGIMGVKYPNE
ncbi:MAG: Gfo/Idh/MocA family oxidoreductase [Eubacteriales bacterium]|nr:Gfo/Idh/MocA family oxidoreductase [Eubacteriales bacterium]